MGRNASVEDRFGGGPLRESTASPGCSGDLRVPGRAPSTSARPTPESPFGHVLWGFRAVRMRPCPVELHLLGVATCWGLNWGSLIKVHDACAGSFQGGGEGRHAGAMRALHEGGNSPCWHHTS